MNSLTGKLFLGNIWTIFFFLVVFLGITPPSNAQERITSQGNITQSQKMIMEPIFQSVIPASQDPPHLSRAELQWLEKSLEHTHLPGPPVPVERGSESKPVVSINIQNDISTIHPIPPVLTDSTPLSAETFTLYTNKDLRRSIPDLVTSVVNEPSVANKGDVVFQTGNWYAAISRDGGRNFTAINPSSGPFTPPTGERFCCDQITIYSPQVDATFWLQQYVQNNGTNTQRINIDMGGDGSWDCAYDFTPSTSFNLPSNRWLDFPDLVLGGNFLYHTTNVFNTADQFTNSLISRYPLNDMGTCVQINGSFFVSSSFGSLRATHGAGATVYFAAHKNTSTIRIWRWAENSKTIFFDDVRHASYTSLAMDGRCPGPDGKDWCQRADSRILGAYVANEIIGFMWGAKQDSIYPFPYTRVARFNENNRRLINDRDIHNPEFAFLYPSVGVNARNHLGGTILIGGGNLNLGCTAWIADDFNNGIFAPLENMLVDIGTSGPDQPKSGDYLSSSPHSPQSNTWIGTCFTYKGGGANSDTHPSFVHFGRERDREVAPPLLTQPILLNPMGTITDTTPTYSWNAVSGATWYLAWVSGPSGNVLAEWVTPTNAGCGGGTGVCTLTPTAVLSSGNHSWWAKGWNATERDGPWSARKDFTVEVIDRLTRPTLLNPMGAITDTTPTYSWNTVSRATWYQVWVNSPSGNVLAEWVSETNAGCDGGTGACTLTPTVALLDGNYGWWAKGWNATERDGPWSLRKDFTLGGVP